MVRIKKILRGVSVFLLIFIALPLVYLKLGLTNLFHLFSKSSDGNRGDKPSDDIKDLFIDKANADVVSSCGSGTCSTCATCSCGHSCSSSGGCGSGSGSGSGGGDGY